MTSAVDWLMSKFGINFARNSKFHIRMTILWQLRDSVTLALQKYYAYFDIRIDWTNIRKKALNDIITSIFFLLDPLKPHVKLLYITRGPMVL